MSLTKKIFHLYSVLRLNQIQYTQILDKFCINYVQLSSTGSNIMNLM